MKEFWDARYKQNEYAYGKEPNTFIKQTLLKLSPKGKALFPAEGEGRNAVFAATLGLEVTAFDISSEAKNKALHLAKQNKVSLNYFTGSFDLFKDEKEQFDFIILNFAHFPANLISFYHKKCQSLLNKNGLVILEGFSKNNLVLTNENPKIGGPKDINMLFSLEEIKNDFNELTTIQLTEENVMLSEGLYHNGVGSVIRYIGQKK